MFAVGDLCVVVKDVFGRAPQTVGEECLITSGCIPRVNSRGEVGPYYEGECIGRLWLFAEEELRKKPPYDGNVKTSWDDLIVWKPKEVVHV